MAAAGFVIPEFPSNPPPVGRYDPFTFTVEEADSEGYGPVSPVEETRSVQPQDFQEWITSLDDQQQEAAFLAAFGPEQPGPVPMIDGADLGDDPSVLGDLAGCDGEAQAALAGSVDDAQMFNFRAQQLQAAYLESIVEATSDPAVSDTIGVWVECMSGQGYEVVDPESASTVGLGLQDQADSIKMAGVDARCRESSGYNEAGRRVLYGYQQEWLDEHPEVLPDYIRISSERIKRSQ